MNGDRVQVKPRPADAVQFARALREGLISTEGQATHVEVVIDPVGGRLAGAFTIDCVAGRFVVTVAERAQ